MVGRPFETKESFHVRGNGYHAYTFRIYPIWAVEWVVVLCSWLNYDLTCVTSKPCHCYRLIYIMCRYKPILSLEEETILFNLIWSSNKSSIPDLRLNVRQGEIEQVRHIYIIRLTMHSSPEKCWQLSMQCWRLELDKQTIDPHKSIWPN